MTTPECGLFFESAAPSPVQCRLTEAPGKQAAPDRSREPPYLQQLVKLLRPFTVIISSLARIFHES